MRREEEDSKPAARSNLKPAPPGPRPPKPNRKDNNKPNKPNNPKDKDFPKGGNK